MTDVATPVRQNKVFIVNPVRDRDYSKAENYGKLEHVVNAFVDFKNHAKVMTIVSASISDAHETDYLLISGLTILNVVAVSAWLARFGKCNILNWVGAGEGSEDGDYHVMPISLKHLADLMGFLSYDKPATPNA